VGTNSVAEVLRLSGTEYQIEIGILGDALRERVDVLVSAIDDGRLPGAITPLIDSFIMTHTGDQSASKRQVLRPLPRGGDL
jgi:hypothetical protein